MTTRTLATARVRVTDWLLYDQFNVSAAAPLASPRTCDPGPGTLTLVQTDGQFSIAAGRLNFLAQATPAFGDQMIYEAVGRARVSGRVFISEINLSQANKIVIIPCWRTTAAYGAFGNHVGNILANSDGTLLFYPPGASSGAFLLGPYSSATTYQLAFVLRGAGSFVAIKGGVYANWTLLWIESIDNTAILYPAFLGFDAAGTLDNLKVADLDAPWNGDDYGIATQRLAGSVAAGTTFTHEANCIVEFTVATLPSASEIGVRIRQQDASNYWRIRALPSGNLSLIEAIAGVESVIVSAAGAVSSGHRIVIVADGTTIRGYSNNVLRWTHSTATNFQAATAGLLSSLGTGGVVSDIISYPRQLSGQPLRALEAVANA